MKKEVHAKVKDLRAHGYYSDPLMLFDNLSANVDAVHDTMCYIHRCEGFAELILEIQGIELAHRYAKIFRAYHMAVTGTPINCWSTGLRRMVITASVMR